MGRDRHPLDQAERIAFHQHAIRKGAAVALIGIADDIFGGARRIEHGLPLDPGRKACAAAPAQAACLDRVDDLLRRLRPRRLRSEEHTSELQSLMRISYAVFCLKKKTIFYFTNTTQLKTHILVLPTKS